VAGLALRLLLLQAHPQPHVKPAHSIGPVQPARAELPLQAGQGHRRQVQDLLGYSRQVFVYIQASIKLVLQEQFDSLGSLGTGFKYPVVQPLQYYSAYCPFICICICE